MTDVDPFGLAQPTEEKKEEATVTQDETGINITYKAGIGYDAPWVVVHAANVKKALELHGIEPDGKGLKELFQVVSKASRAFHDTYAETDRARVVEEAKKSVAAWQGPSPRLNASGKLENVPAPSRPAPAESDDEEAPTTPPEWMGPAPDCAHSRDGKKKFVTKVGQFGRWYAWGCGAPKDSPEHCAKSLEFVKKPKNL